MTMMEENKHKLALATKQEARRYVRGLKKQYAEERLVELSAPVIAALLADSRLREARTVLLYHSLPDEVYTHRLIGQMLEQGKRVFLPVVISDTEMEIREYTSHTGMEQGNYSIFEPQGEPFTDYDAIDVAVIPGMAFDGQGHRLGRGRGYYDRFLAQAARTYKIGVCFPFQFLPAIPCEPTDVPMDKVVCGG